MHEHDLELRPHPLGTSNGELRVSIDVVHLPTGKVIEADAINLRSRISRRRLAEGISRQVDDGDVDRIDGELLRLIPAAEAAAIAGPKPEDAPPLPFRDVQPCEYPVDGAELLVNVERFVGRYVVLPEHAGLAVAAWIVAAWSIDTWDRFPHLLVHSPAKRCGKTRLLSVLAYLCPRALSAASISPAAMYRVIQQYQPTLLIDEAQWLTRQRSESAESLRELLCAGAERTASVLRVGGPDRDTLQSFRVYSPKVLAHIGEPDDVLADRSIVVRMDRKQRGEHVTPWRSRAVEAVATDLARQLCRWSDDHRERLAELYDNGQSFELGNDRAGEMFLPLATVVELADADRLVELERVARALTPGETDGESVGIQLLAALGEIFDGVDFLSTESILDRLHNRKDEPWLTWGRQGKPMTAHALAGQLKRFKVSPSPSPDRTIRGYYRDSFVATWQRYLGCPDSHHTSAQSARSVQTATNPEPFSAAAGASGASGASQQREPGEEG